MKEILIIGDRCKDVYIYGKVNRLCPDAPVPVFVPIHETTTGGMAENVYENVVSLKYPTKIITNSNPIYKTRYVEEKTNHMIIRVDSDLDNIPRIEDLDKIDFDKYECVIISDYNKGFLTYDDIEYICNNHSRVFIDTKKIINGHFKNAFCIKINNVEYNNHKVAGHNLDEHPANLIVTLGNKGCRFKNEIFPVDEVEIKDMSGAGDTFIASLVVEFSKTQDLKKSIEFANKCSTIVVQHKGVNKVGNYL